MKKFVPKTFSCVCPIMKMGSLDARSAASYPECQSSTTLGDTTLFGEITDVPIATVSYT